MKRLSVLFLASMLAVVVGACGGSAGADNVAACKSWVESAKCGAVDPSTQGVDCNAYENTTCDISEYFDCLTPKYSCVNGMYDTTKLATSGECASKATCK